MKKWKCNVCGYIHTGDEPPDKCPVCGADRSEFVEIEETIGSEKTHEPTEGAPKAVSESSGSSGVYDFAIAQILKHHLHPVSVHIPNGVIPVSVLFVFLAVIFNFSNLMQAAVFNLVVVVLTIPVVIFSGYVEWKNKYGGKMTPYFMIKIICAIIITFAAVILVVWYMLNPDVNNSSSSSRWLYLFINVIMVSAATVAGFIGGKLVFKE